MKKPKTLYEYQDKKLTKHVISPECCPQLIAELPTGTRWRCKHEHPGPDFHGWEALKVAKKQEIYDTLERINEEQDWLAKLRRVEA